MERHTDLVLNDYRVSRTEVNRLFFAGLLFTLACHFYVIEPYFQLKIKEHSLQQSLPDMERTIGVLADEAAKIAGVQQAATTGLQQVRDQLLQFPDQLRNVLPDIKKALEQSEYSAPGRTLQASPYQQQYGQTAPQYIQEAVPRGNGIMLPAGIKSFEAAVNWYINNWFARLLTEMEDGVVKPVLGLDATHSGGGDKELAELGKNAVENVKKNINGIDPDFWRSYGGRGGKIDVAYQVREGIETAFAPLEDKVRQLLDESKRLLQSQEEELDTQRQNLADTQKSIHSLSERLKDIESPFGPLPLSMTDLIKLFPFLLVALAVKMAMAMIQGRGQRALLKRILEVDDGSVISRQLYTYHLRSLLLAAEHRFLFPAAMTTWLVILFLVFIRSFRLISQYPQIFFTGGQQGISAEYQLYQTACLAGLAVFLGAAACMLGISGSLGSRRPPAADR